ncbi:hypothetical protein LguiB_000664 [Lonicera macranthoides]
MQQTPEVMGFDIMTCQKVVGLCFNGFVVQQIGFIVQQTLLTYRISMLQTLTNHAPVCG